MKNKSPFEGDLAEPILELDVLASAWSALEINRKLDLLASRYNLIPDDTKQFYFTLVKHVIRELAPKFYLDDRGPGRPSVEIKKIRDIAASDYIVGEWKRGNKLALYVALLETLVPGLQTISSPKKRRGRPYNKPDEELVKAVENGLRNGLTKSAVCNRTAKRKGVHKRTQERRYAKATEPLDRRKRPEMIFGVETTELRLGIFHSN